MKAQPIDLVGAKVRQQQAAKRFKYTQVQQELHLKPETILRSILPALQHQAHLLISILQQTGLTTYFGFPSKEKSPKPHQTIAVSFLLQEQPTHLLMQLGLLHLMEVFGHGSK